MARDAERHPFSSMVREITGRNSNCPVANAVPRMPRTSPRWWANQRFAIRAPRTRAVEPVASPTNTPHSTVSCHDCVMKTVRPVPSASSAMAPATMRRTPKRSMRAVANGAVTP